MPMAATQQTGFSLMELIVALILTGLLATSIAQFQTASLQIRLLIQQEALAARTAEDLALQINSSLSSPDHWASVLKEHGCFPPQPPSAFDFSLFCQAKQRLPELHTKQQGAELLLTWQSPLGKRKVRRPTQ